MEDTKKKIEKTTRPVESDSSTKRKRENYVCNTCGKSDVEFSGSQKKRIRNGKGGECKKCVTERCEWKARAQAAQWAKPGGSYVRRPTKKFKTDETETKANEEHGDTEKEGKDIKEKAASCST